MQEAPLTALGDDIEVREGTYGDKVIPCARELGAAGARTDGTARAAGDG